MRNLLRPRKGQILVVFAILLTTLLGFTALAIDGGMIFVDRRYSQSVADSAALAGAGTAIQYLDTHGVTYAENYYCGTGALATAISQAGAAARSRAAANQITDLDFNLTDKHGIEVLCVNDLATFDKHIDVHVQITTTVRTSFIHFVFPGIVKNTVDAVVRVAPRTELAYGNAIVSLGSGCGSNAGGVNIDGGPDTVITGGGIFSNTCIKRGGNSASTEVTSAGAAINYNTTISENGSMSPTPVQVTAQLPRLPINEPICSGTNYGARTSAGTISPGIYSKIKLTGGTLAMQPGLYCMDGDFDISGGGKVVAGDDTGEGVTLYFRSGGVTINGNSRVNMYAAGVGHDVDGAIPGLLFYAAEGNSGTFKLNGTSTSSFAGTVYIPDGSLVVGGNGSVLPTYSTQLVANYVEIFGSADLNINYEDSPHMTVEPILQVQQ